MAAAVAWNTVPGALEDHVQGIGRLNAAIFAMPSSRRELPVASPCSIHGQRPATLPAVRSDFT
jgi:hypothetical protein